MLKALRGTKDILPVDVVVWQHIEQSARKIFTIYGYREIRTPIIEEASLFIRSIGEATDIVQKQMYVFSDRGGRNIALRPEATASVVRAYLENSIGNKESLVKLFYIGPMFRSERPQKGRQRQFHQLGVEAIGSDNPFLDIEVILLAVNFLKKINIHDFRLKINSLGCSKDKVELIEKCKKAAKSHLSSLCKECNDRYSKNVLRIFDCKNPQCADVLRGIELKGSLCKDCDEHFEIVKKGLRDLDVDYEFDSKIVRGLDYYTKTVFEITQKDLGTKDAVCAGGRYNNLIKDMGGRDTPAIGFAFGMERLSLVVKNIYAQRVTKKVFIATSEEKFYIDAFELMNILRSSGIECDIDYEGKSLKAQMKKAEKTEARFVVIFGEDEFHRDSVVLRDMEKRDQSEVRISDLVKEMKST